MTGPDGRADDPRQDAPALSVAALRTEGEWISARDHFCQLCRCAKSGEAHIANAVQPWCGDTRCRCHDEELE